MEVARRYILLPRPELPPAYLELARSRTLRERWGHFLDNVFLPRPQMERAYSLPSGSPLLAIAYLRRIGNLLLRRSGLFLRPLAATDAMRAHRDRGLCSANVATNSFIGRGGHWGSPTGTPHSHSPSGPRGER